MTAPLANPLPSARSRELALLVEQLALPFRSRAWRGSSGGWQGMNQGSSIDFQDHRAYVPGDDPRHLDWAAYARTDHYTMKLFREEVSPRLDVALDVSHSMALTLEKEARALDLLRLVLRLALRDNVSPRIYTVSLAGPCRRLEIPAALALESLASDSTTTQNDSPLSLAEIPWRNGSLRVLVSDLLVPQSPAALLSQLTREQGRVVILAPWLQDEAEPHWQGNLELHDCETALLRQQRVEPLLLARYRKCYQRHFELWQEESRRRRVPLARVPCEIPLGAAVRRQALPAGVFELRH